MKNLVVVGLALLMGSGVQAQEGYGFKPVKEIAVTSVKNQAISGTCWCFATTSFMEAELLRMHKGTYDLSEMYIVRQKYKNQLADNFLRRGKGNVGQGSLSHTFMNAYRQVGILPESVYTGIQYDSERHNHSEIEGYVSALAKEEVLLKNRSEQVEALENSLFDIYMGEIPQQFTYEGKEYTAASFTASLGLNMDDYIELTSFTHHPFYKKMEIEVPDNWEHQLMYNLPLDELQQVIDAALNQGFTVCWDGDVSEAGFSAHAGVAIMPDGGEVKDLSKSDRARFEKLSPDRRRQEILKFEQPYPELAITPEQRQQGFERFKTTDDHLMHITGLMKDKKGKLYYRTKNSWGTNSVAHQGYVYMSPSYFRAKTIYIMVHKDAIPEAIKKELGL